MILRQKEAGKGRENILGDLGSVSVLRRGKRNALIFCSPYNVPSGDSHPSYPRLYTFQKHPFSIR